MEIDHRLRRLAEQQYGVIGRHQAAEAGASWEAMRSRTESGVWVPWGPRVVLLDGTPRAAKQALMAAALDAGPGALIGRLSAAALWQVPGFPFGPVQVLRRRVQTSRRQHIGDVWQLRDLRPEDGTRIGPIPVTTLAVTLFHLVPYIHPGQLARAIDTTSNRSPALLATLHALVEERGGRGVKGIGVLRDLLAERPPGTRPYGSRTEERFAQILRDAGERPMRRQVDVGGHDWLGRVDFLDDLLHFIAEVDSRAHHSSVLDCANDRERDEAARAAGFRGVLRLAEEDVWQDPSHVLCQVRRVRRLLADPSVCWIPPDLAGSSRQNGL